MDCTPLAERFRPKDFESIAGQTGAKAFILRTIEQKRPVSILLYGPPGSGKTSLARLYAKAFDMRFVALSAVRDGIAELKKWIQEADATPLLGKSILLFVDEIHRFNKAQQDAFLPYVESGKIVLVAATAENPSFYLNPALLSRLRVLKLQALDDLALHTLIDRYEKTIKPLPLSEKARQFIIQMAHGDGRYLLNLIENLEHCDPSQMLEREDLEKILQARAALYDRSGENHYNLISALHKSIRGSDPDAALYWFSRMLEGGEDPLFLARRLIRIASEDIGLADSEALKLSIAARDAYQALGSPEGELALAQAVIYLALAPKSNAVYKAYNESKALAAKTGQLPPPDIILNAPTNMMKELGYGKGYRYDHEEPNAFSGQDYFPEKLGRQTFYNPVERGFERECLKRLEYFKRLRTSSN